VKELGTAVTSPFKVNKPLMRAARSAQTGVWALSKSVRARHFFSPRKPCASAVFKALTVVTERQAGG
jgi:hypothetical protein